jgi:hypothetical protein
LARKNLARGLFDLPYAGISGEFSKLEAGKLRLLLLYLLKGRRARFVIEHAVKNNSTPATLR